MKRHDLHTWHVALLCMVLPATVPAGDVALIVGIGAVRVAAREGQADPPTWNLLSQPAARRDAEAAFRRLMPKAARELSLYSHSPRWFGDGPATFDSAVLITDGVTDNTYIPLSTLLISESRRLAQDVGPNDDYLMFLSGVGEVAGWESSIRDRLHQAVGLQVLADALPPAGERGRRVLVLRLYPEKGSQSPVTLLVADPGSMDRLRGWVEAAARKVSRGLPADQPDRLMPALPPRWAALTSLRLQRMQARLARPGSLRNGLELIDSGQAMEPAEQEVNLAIAVTEKRIYRKITRPGPLFTILEEDSDVVDRIEWRIDPDVVVRGLTDGDITVSAAREVVKMLAGRVGSSFRNTILHNGVAYQMMYDHSRKALQVRYLD